MQVKFHNPQAFAAFTRPVLWTQDAAPHKRGTFCAAILQGESQQGSAGPTTDGILADPWSVIVPLECALVADMQIGDTLGLGPAYGGTVLTIQQITRTAHNYTIRATANERVLAP